MPAVKAFKMYFPLGQLQLIWRSNFSLNFHTIRALWA